MDEGQLQLKAQELREQEEAPEAQEEAARAALRLAVAAEVQGHALPPDLPRAIQARLHNVDPGDEHLPPDAAAQQQATVKSHER